MNGQYTIEVEVAASIPSGWIKSATGLLIRGGTVVAASCRYTCIAQT